MYQYQFQEKTQMSQEKAKKLFERHCNRIDWKVEQLKKCSTRYSWWRAGVFILIIAYAYFTAGILNDYLWTTGLLAGIAGFIFLVDHHYKVHQSIEKFGHLKKTKQQHIARMELNWNDIPEPSLELQTRDHPFANDLDLTGPRSLHQLLDTSIYEGSTRVLLEWLMEEQPDKKEILHRQQLVKELIPLQSFRDKLSVIGLYTITHISEKDWTMDEMIKWLRQPKKTGFKIPLAVLSVLSVANISLGILALSGMLSLMPFVISLLIYMSVYKLNSEKIAGLFDAAYQLEKLMSRFRSLLLHVEDFTFNKRKGLAEFLEIYHRAGTKPSVYLKKVRKLAGAASLQKNMVLWPVVNLVVPWDMYHSMKMEELKAELEPKLSEWLDDFYKLEALNSMANFAALNPECTFPEIDDDPEVLFKAENLGHPLIPAGERVTNNFEVKEGKDLFLITGSNMAGKSTFLRTVGINLVLTFAGGPVNASQLRTNLFRLFTSINVKDSLGDGLSHFYAEVRRLKRLLNELDGKHDLPLFFFVDEIFKGTNNRERFQGSTAFLKNIAGKKGVGMVSTHDLELASLEKEITELSNWHFSETIEGDKMSFGYKIKTGPCPTTNALKIMEMEGLPVE